jgi:hypothetical protein
MKDLKVALAIDIPGTFLKSCSNIPLAMFLLVYNSCTEGKNTWVTKPGLVHSLYYSSSLPS